MLHSLPAVLVVGEGGNMQGGTSGGGVALHTDGERKESSGLKHRRWLPLTHRGAKERAKRMTNKGEVRDLFQSRRLMLQSESHLARLPPNSPPDGCREQLEQLFLSGDLVRKKKSFAKRISQGRLFIMRLFLIEQQP